MYKIKANIKARLRVMKRKRFPSVIQLQTSSACNAKCTCCPYHSIQKDLPVRLMPDDLYHKIIDECSLHGVKKISLYLFNEPLLDKRIVERLKYVKAKNPASQIRVSTNASLLNEKISPEIADVVDFLYISIQGGITNKDRYEKTMGLDYDRVYKNVLNFIEIIKTGNYNLKLNNTAINNVISFENERDLEAEKKFWENKGLKTLNLGGYSTWANKVNASTNNFSKNIRGCSLKHRPLSHIHILENGDVVLCCRDWNKEIILGNLRHASIFDIWNSQEYRDIIEKVYCGKKAENNFICYRCEDAIRI